MPDEGVEQYSPDQLGGAGQKLTGVGILKGVARPVGVARPEGVALPPAINESRRGAALRSGAQGQIVVRHDVPASVGVQTDPLRDVTTVTALWEP